MSDNVNHPPHYTKGGIECIDAIRAALGARGFIAYCRGCVIKYHWRSPYKGRPQEDHEKAAWYSQKAAVAQADADREYEEEERERTPRDNRWETGIRNLVTMLWGPNTEFQIGDVVHEVEVLLQERDELKNKLAVATAQIEGLEKAAMTKTRIAVETARCDIFNHLAGRDITVLTGIEPTEHGLPLSRVIVDPEKLKSACFPPDTRSGK